MVLNIFTMSRISYIKCTIKFQLSSITSSFFLCTFMGLNMNAMSWSLCMHVLGCCAIATICWKLKTGWSKKEQKFIFELDLNQAVSWSPNIPLYGIRWSLIILETGRFLICVQPNNFWLYMSPFSDCFGLATREVVSNRLLNNVWIILLVKKKCFLIK